MFKFISKHHCGVFYP